MRNYIGGWSATYDSCIAQRAIVGYAVLRGFEIIAYNVKIDFSSSSSLDHTHTPINIVDENLIETQVRDVENVYGVVYIDGFGNGYALIQVCHLFFLIYLFNKILLYFIHLYSDARWC